MTAFVVTGKPLTNQIDSYLEEIGPHLRKTFARVKKVPPTEIYIRFRLPEMWYFTP